MATTADKKAARLDTREQAATTSRHWVRLTSCCNNRCLFCLDSEAQDGRSRTTDDIIGDIEAGARLGRRRLILSGGEPTIHPDLLRLIGVGKTAGYERVQIISNGRMFARKELLDAAVDAGLGELTISVHGHRAELHDRLVGVPGAFVQTIGGLKNALARRELIVNVDIVVCGPNVEHVDRIIALCQRLGVHEFDLLQVQPAGRAAKTDGILYDVAPAMDALARVFDLSRRSDLFLWTNRFPISHLEGFEELIQDPHKLVDEVRGRFELVEALLTDNQPLRCRGELCDACFLAPLCDELHGYADRLVRADFDEVLFDLRTGPPLALPTRLAEGIQRARVVAHSYSAAVASCADSHLPGSQAALWLEEPKGLASLATSEELQLGGLPVLRVGSKNVEVLEEAMRLGVAELEVNPTAANASWLAALNDRAGDTPAVVVRPAPRSSLSGCLESELPPAELNAILANMEVAVENLPLCLAGGHSVTWTEMELQPELANGPGRAEVELFVERFAATHYRAKSVRCEQCADGESCRGQLVQRLRAFGLETLKPRR